MVKDSHIFSFKVTDPILKAGAHPILGKTLVASNGQEWRRARSVISPTFSSSRMKSMYAKVRDCLNELFESMEPYGKNGTPAELKTIYGNLTMDVIATCAFGTKVNSYRNGNSPFIHNANMVFNPNPIRLLMQMMLPTGLLKAMRLKHVIPESANEFFFEMTRTIMRERKRQDMKYNDFLELAMNSEYNEGKDGGYGSANSSGDDEAKDVNGNVNTGKSAYGKTETAPDPYITNEEILANAWDFFTTGYESMATTLSFASYELSRKPEIQERLHDEVRASLDANGEIEYDQLGKMNYLDAVVSETLRLHTISIRLGRMASQDYKLGDTGIVVEKGQTVEIPVYAVHHSEEFYPNAPAFEPERFMPENSHKLIPYTFLPFGTGHRSCVGTRFALMVVKLALAHVVQRYRFVITDKTDIPVLLKSSVLNHTPERVILGLEPRAL
ncbi:unnamed protein product [Medioppia subpectinata]|uniref:Cytochrome P450 n=1 Tax=Medioppia subpectinata TaxID=1979941 RepID=A0A7R9QED0_9ACAR|nr:unnamed protein product [Medioppia subpectinata]CAG2119273.1 unnamed protein product [Medioppia subpectinata]